jgi:hypothetical protein
LDSVTYSLRQYNSAAANSAGFYSAVEGLTDLVLHEAEAAGLGDMARQRSDKASEEHVFELLLLGVLWNTYQQNALAFPPRLSWLYSFLYRLRKRHAFIKLAIDKLRGLLTAILVRRSEAGLRQLSMESLPKLLVWLAATCEYREEVKRLEQWQQCLEHTQSAAEQLRKIELFATWFEQESAAKLGRFTKQVALFLAGVERNYRFREDAIFCGRRQVEYHLNMVGATIMNRTFRPRFLQVKQKVVLLPLCMSARQDGGCQAKSETRGLVCAGCSTQCRIHQIKQLGEKVGFDVLIVPHSSGFTQWLRQWRDQDQCGVVAVACVLNLLAGGYEMQSLNIPAQCVFLDYCGCQKHWRERGIPTDLDESRLLQIIGNRTDTSIAV